MLIVWTFRILIHLVGSVFCSSFLGGVVPCQDSCPHPSSASSHHLHVACDFQLKRNKQLSNQHEKRLKISFVFPTHSQILTQLLLHEPTSSIALLEYVGSLPVPNYTPGWESRISCLWNQHDGRNQALSHRPSAWVKLQNANQIFCRLLFQLLKLIAHCEDQISLMLHPQFAYMIFIYFTIIGYRYITNSQLTNYPCGLVAQWIEHCTGIARSWVRIPFNPHFYF